MTVVTLPGNTGLMKPMKERKKALREYASFSWSNVQVEQPDTVKLTMKLSGQSFRVEILNGAVWKVYFSPTHWGQTNSERDARQSIAEYVNAERKLKAETAVADAPGIAPPDQDDPKP